MCFTLWQFFRQDMRPVFAMFSIEVFPDKPQCRVQPEECESAQQQANHALRRKPHLGILLKFVSRTMRLECDIAFGCTFVAGLAGFLPVIDVHHGGFIVKPLDPMGAVTVVTLGRLPIAQPGNFAVIGFRVGLQVFLVTVAAVFRNGQPA